MLSKTFLLTHTFRDISKLSEGEIYCSDIEIRYNIPWSIQVFKNECFLGLLLNCEKEELLEKKKWSLQVKFTMKLVAVGGKFFQRTVQHEFQKSEEHGMDKFISWENMQRDYMNNDSIIIEIHADVVSSSGFFKQRYSPCSQIYSGKSFVLKHNFKNIWRFVEAERCFSDIEEHYNIPWRLRIQKYNGFLGIHLLCEKEECDGRRWSIQCEYELQLISSKGKCYTRNNTFDFEKPGGNYREVEFINWNVMEEEYMDNDSICVEAHVKICKTQELPCNILSTHRKFVLSHTVRNISSINGGNVYFTDIETRFNVPWKLSFVRQNGFIELYLRCEKKQCLTKPWSIEAQFTLKLVSPNGRSLSLRKTYSFEKSIGNGYSKVMRWDEMKDKYVVDNSIIIEAHVKILNMTGIEDETTIEKTSGFTIPVGDKEYTMEKWMEMAFDH